MTIEEILANEGYTAEEAQVLIANPKYAGTLKKLVDTAENGTTALLKAQELEQNIRKFNDETVIPYGAKKDAEAAQARAEAAKYQTYLKSLKDAGYEIPDAYLPAASAEPVKPATDPATGQFVKPSDLDSQGRAYMSLLSTVNRAHKLGIDLDVDSDYDEMKKSARPGENFRDYIDRKYDLSALEKKKADEKEQARLDAYAATKLDEWKKANPRSENEDLRTPAASKHDKFKAISDEKKNSWQTREGREASTVARQEKYKNILVQ
jgi:uncharacterized protein RhaS with RHS repeats